MHLRILLPTRILFDDTVSKVIAEAENGSFCLLPQHVDIVAALTAGILTFTTDEGIEQFAATDEGILVKYGPDVFVSVRDAVLGADLGLLRLMIRENFEELDDREKRARGALARLEANFLHRFIELRD